MGSGKLLITAGLLLGTGIAATDEGRLVERLRSDYAARVAAEQDFREQRQRGVLDGTEASDYAEFVARLQRRVAEDCVAVREAGLHLPPDVECPALPPRAVAPAAIDQTAEKTPEEGVAALDAQLFVGLGQFDELLLREQERIRIEAPMPSVAHGTGGGESARAGARGRAAAETADASAPREEADPGAGPGTPRRQERTETAPADIPEGSDDDLVARQLREAAEKEPDPELKRKLWEEYRRYKEGLR